ncbi:methyltransferase domain-containing protein [Dehalococcoides mccartyi]|nr:methyltransferase domain-containing protein [Dehalococcoides mccartyi]
MLLAIDAAPKYQSIPPEMFTDPIRQRYLIWRERFTSRVDHTRMEYIDIAGQKVLDIGCNAGYFGWSNSAEIDSYVGIDNDPTVIAAASAISDSLDLTNLTWITSDVSRFFESDTDEYDVCLFFSVYHHLLYGLGITAAEDLLRVISARCRTMYFDMGQVDEPTNPARKAWHSLLPNRPPAEYIRQLVLDNSDYSRAEIVGETPIGNSKRLLFRFDR